MAPAQFDQAGSQGSLISWELSARAALLPSAVLWSSCSCRSGTLLATIGNMEELKVLTSGWQSQAQEVCGEKRRKVHIQQLPISPQPSFNLGWGRNSFCSCLMSPRCSSQREQHSEQVWIEGCVCNSLQQLWSLCGKSSPAAF